MGNIEAVLLSVIVRTPVLCCARSWECSALDLRVVVYAGSQSSCRAHYAGHVLTGGDISRQHLNSPPLINGRICVTDILQLQLVSKHVPLYAAPSWMMVRSPRGSGRRLPLGLAHLGHNRSRPSVPDRGPPVTGFLNFAQGNQRAHRCFRWSCWEQLGPRNWVVCHYGAARDDVLCLLESAIH